MGASVTAWIFPGNSISLAREARVNCTTFTRGSACCCSNASLLIRALRFSSGMYPPKNAITINTASPKAIAQIVWFEGCQRFCDGGFKPISSDSLSLDLMDRIRDRDAEAGIHGRPEP